MSDNAGPLQGFPGGSGTILSGQVRYRSLLNRDLLCQYCAIAHGAPRYALVGGQALEFDCERKWRQANLQAPRKAHWKLSANSARATLAHTVASREKAAGMTPRLASDPSHEANHPSTLLTATTRQCASQRKLESLLFQTCNPF